jgi:phospholipid/cholesterol/gamma-HCH transport system substrate-binding protein
MVAKTVGRDIKVGLFVLAGLVFAGLVIFFIGDERRLFDPSVEFATTFYDVQGLKPGAPIRMGGLDIGQVTEVGYGDDPADTTVYVTLDIVRSEAGRIKVDSRARIATKGLLGDKIVEITRGKAAESVKPGGRVEGEEPDDMMGRVNVMAEKAERTLTSIERVSEGLADEGLHKDIRASAASLNAILDEVARGDGYPHRLLSDREEAERISRTLSSVERAAGQLDVTMAEVRSVVARVRSGPGFAHDVIYGDGPQKQVAQIGDAAGELAVALRGVRESDSFAHDVLYGGKGDGAEALSNVTAMTADLRSILRDVRAGKGTVGALLVDPSLYDDMKIVLGNAARNDVLRALVRYSIKQDEKKPAVQIGDAP